MGVDKLYKVAASDRFMGQADAAQWSLRLRLLIDGCLTAQKSDQKQHSECHETFEDGIGRYHSSSMDEWRSCRRQLLRECLLQRSME
jgi:hypothetical protein